MSNDYAIVPENDFSKLKKDVDNIKNNPFGQSKEGQEMLRNLKDLNDSLSSLVNLFNTATEELKQEEHDSALVSEKLGPMLDRVEELGKQNEKIAKGIVAVADMVKEVKNEMQKNTSSQMGVSNVQGPPPSNLGMTNPQVPDYLANPPQDLGVPPSGPPQMPPPESGGFKPLPANQMPSMEGGEKKKGLFGRK
ncbi:hypothetical protein GOV05_04800 [Candidatus Woesearchaeota archaeon]|nr:hypothetical protein [Candidatus Woesearchaeota archaeon]